MMMVRSLVLLLLWMTTLLANAAEYQVGAAPAWVEPLPVDLARQPASGKSSGEWNLLSDVQTRIEKTGRTNYYHYANKALDADGVHDIADISFVFDPSYEQLTIHAIRVLRDGQRIDKLAGARISVLQREKELEYRIYDGSKTVSVLLDDLRVGDVVEYAYSRRGINPVFGNRIAGGAELQWAVPVGQASIRLLVPAGRAIATQVMNSSLQAQVREIDGYREYRWAQQDVPGLKVEHGAPSNYVPYARVRWSEFADWKAVVDWGLPLYRLDGKLGPALDAAVDNIRRTAATPEERARAVLQLVQANIRYLGVEVGTGSYAPSAPATVFQRRFGDCKDKALLVVAMLRELGVHAAPALVSTERREAVAAVLPAPQVFNHVVVRATINGRHYWLDPTTSPQGGDLEHMVQSDHGLALVLDEGETGLSKMAGLAGRNRKQVRAVFDGREGPDKPMRYTITTVMHGVVADDVRDMIARRGVADTQSQYVNYYARQYPDIKAAAPLRYEDDLQHNQFTTVESYEIPEFWKRPEPNKRRQGYIRSSEIRSLLSTPDFLNRSAPLATNYPQEIEEVTDVLLAGEWKVKPEKVDINDPAFEFHHTTERGEGDVTYRLSDRLLWLKARVEPAEVRSYSANLDKAYDEVGLTLYLGNSTAAAAPVHPERFKVSWAVAGQGALLLAAWAILAAICWRSPEEHRSHNWYLLVQLVWITAALWILATAFPSSWKTQTLAIIVVFFGSIALRRNSMEAPETHWQHANGPKPAGVRYLVHGLDVLPALCALVGSGYYIKALLD